jgi:hypothetical protein
MVLAGGPGIHNKVLCKKKFVMPVTVVHGFVCVMIIPDYYLVKWQFIIPVEDQ